MSYAGLGNARPEAAASPLSLFYLFFFFFLPFFLALSLIWVAGFSSFKVGKKLSGRRRYFRKSPSCELAGADQTELLKARQLYF